MPAMALDAEHYRKHAFHTRKLAELTSDIELKRAYETIAREFDSLLLELEVIAHEHGPR
jgi:hypothetical protein